MVDFLCFRRMLTPVLLQIFFWIIVAFCIYTAVYQIIDHQSIWKILEVLILGPIVARIFIELLILFFRMNETLTDIKHNGDALIRRYSEERDR